MKGRSHKGFTVVEVLVAAIGGIILLGLLVVATARISDEDGRVISAVVIDSDQALLADSTLNLNRAPDPETTNEMLLIMQQLVEEVERADVVFVFGSKNSNPGGADTEPLVRSPSFTLVSGNYYIASGLTTPRDMPRSVREAAALLASGEFLSGGSDEDFSIVTMFKDGQIGSVTSVYRLSGVINSVDQVVVYLVDQKRYSGATINTTTCSYYIMANDLGSGLAVPVGAQANWFRIDPTWDREEQGPTFVALPDPMARFGTDTEPVSRFNLLLPTLN